MDVGFQNVYKAAFTRHEVVPHLQPGSKSYQVVWLVSLHQPGMMSFWHVLGRSLMGSLFSHAEAYLRGSNQRPLP